MTKLGAIIRINTLYKLYAKDEPESEHYLYAEARCMAINALEKQIPKEPIDKIMHKECPICGAVDLGRYCMECGQAIKWE